MYEVDNQEQKLGVDSTFLLQVDSLCKFFKCLHELYTPHAEIFFTSRKQGGEVGLNMQPTH